MLQVLAVLIGSVTSCLAATGGLYGLAGPTYQDGQSSLVKYDTETGTVTTVKAAEGSYLTGEQLAALDPINNIFYFYFEKLIDNNTQIESGLYGYSLTAPNTDLKPTVLPIRDETFVGAGVAIIGDPLNGDIFVFAGSPKDEDTQLLLKVTRDSNGKQNITTVKEYTDEDVIPLLAGPPSVFDSKRKTMWIASSYGDNTDNVTVNYLYISATNGDIIKQIPAQDFPLGVAQYDVNSDMIVGVEPAYEKDGNFSYSVLKVDPVTLEVKDRLPADKEWCSYSPVDSIDIKNSVGYYIIYLNPFGDCRDMNGTLDGHLVSFDLNSGAIDYSPMVCGLSSERLDCPWALEYWPGST